jgi:hypothetical protein
VFSKALSIVTYVANILEHEHHISNTLATH